MIVPFAHSFNLLGLFYFVVKHFETKPKLHWQNSSCRYNLFPAEKDAGLVVSASVLLCRQAF